MEFFTYLEILIYLSVDAALKFIKDAVQDKDGDTIANYERHGTVYIMKQTARCKYTKLHKVLMINNYLKLLTNNVDLLFHRENFLCYRNYMTTYFLLDKLKVLVLHYSNLFHDMNYFLPIPNGMAAVRSLMLRLMTIHQISFIFLRQRIVQLVV